MIAQRLSGLEKDAAAQLPFSSCLLCGKTPGTMAGFLVNEAVGELASPGEKLVLFYALCEGCKAGAVLGPDHVLKALRTLLDPPSVATVPEAG